MKKIILTAIAGITIGYFVRKIKDKATTLKLTHNICGTDNKTGTKLKTL